MRGGFGQTHTAGVLGHDRPGRVAAGPPDVPGARVGGVVVYEIGPGHGGRPVAVLDDAAVGQRVDRDGLHVRADRLPADGRVRAGGREQRPVVAAVGRQVGQRVAVL